MTDEWDATFIRAHAILTIPPQQRTEENNRELLRLTEWLKRNVESDETEVQS